MSDIASWCAVGLAILAAIIAWVSYKNQRGRMRLEYAVIANIRLLPESVPKELKVHLGDRSIDIPSIIVIRFVNTGDKPINVADFEGPMVLSFDEVSEVVEVSVTKVRPAEFNVEAIPDGAKVRISPVLINPGDLMQMQILTSGVAKSVNVAGRISGLSAISMRSLPYPPGSGREGEMLLLEKFIWYLFAPATLLGFGVIAVVYGSSPTSRAVGALIALFVVVAIYPLVVRKLVIRRKIWRP
jgi:hypothetical protein